MLTSAFTGPVRFVFLSAARQTSKSEKSAVLFGGAPHVLGVREKRTDVVWASQGVEVGLDQNHDGDEDRSVAEVRHVHHLCLESRKKETPTCKPTGCHQGSDLFTWNLFMPLPTDSWLLLNSSGFHFFTCKAQKIVEGNSIANAKLIPIPNRVSSHLAKVGSVGQSRSLAASVADVQAEKIAAVRFEVSTIRHRGHGALQDLFDVALSGALEVVAVLVDLRRNVLDDKLVQIAIVDTTVEGQKKNKKQAECVRWRVKE